MMGISHPVLQNFNCVLDHLLAMICVGILSAQLGGRAIWTVPLIFVIVMTIGGLFGFLLIVQEFFFVEIGIILSVILLGLAISIQKKIPIFLIMIFVGNFWSIPWNCSWIRNSSCIKSNFIYIGFYMWNYSFTCIWSDS